MSTIFAALLLLVQHLIMHSYLTSYLTCFD